MSIFPRLHLLLALVMMVALVFLYQKTRSVDPVLHNRLLASVNDLRRVNATLNQHILELRHGRLTFYDPVDRDLEKMEFYQQKITGLLKTTYASVPPGLQQPMDDIAQTLQKREKLIDRFKSSNALLHNSLLYLPAATPQFVNSLPEARYPMLPAMLNNLLLDLLRYNLQANDDDYAGITRKVEQLQDMAGQMETRYREELTALLAHAVITLENKQQTDALVERILDDHFSESLQSFYHRYLDDYQQRASSVRIFKAFLYVLSLLMLVFIVIILLRLNKTAKKLRQSLAELNYQTYAMDEHAIVSITDAQGRILYANDKFCQSAKRRRDELIGQNHRILKSGHHDAEFYAQMWETISRGKVWHGQICNRAGDGSLFWVETTIVPFADDAGEPYKYVAIRTDITLLKQVREQLRLNTTALEVAANSILITDQDGKILWVNQAFCEMTGYTAEEVIGQTPRLLRSSREDPAVYDEIWQTITANQVWRGQIINQRKDGSTYTEEQTISPVCDAQGRITHFIAIKQDISQRLQTEEALRRSQKMEAVGQLSGGIAHDFNNQLGVIVGYLDFLDNALDDAKQLKWVQTARRASQRCIDLTRQLLAFSRHQAVNQTLIDVNEVIGEIQTMISRSITPQIETGYQLDAALWTVEADAGELQDALLNMAINARDAMPEGGRLQIETRNVTLDKAAAAVNPEARAGDFVRIRVGDTGEGMDEATLQRLFEPFFTTKPKGKGTGLGMAMVYGFVKRYKGFLTVQSEPGKGTIIDLFLPRSESDDTAPAEDAGQAGALPRGDETLLIVDDEADLLELAGHYLADLGYRTLCAENAAGALDLLRKHEDIALLFSDIVMPGGMNGYELAKQARALRPEIKVLLTTGFSQEQQQDVDGQPLSVLTKPYQQAELAACVRTLLDTGRCCDGSACNMD